jgi:hypothetical protein
MKKANSLSSLTQEELMELMDMGIDPSQIFSIELPKHQVKPNVTGNQRLPLVLTPKGASALPKPSSAPVPKVMNPNVVDPTPNSFDPFGNQKKENRYYYEQDRARKDSLGIPRVNDDGTKNYDNRFMFELKNQEDTLSDVNNANKGVIAGVGEASSYLNNYKQASRNQLDNMRAKQMSVFGGQPEYEPYNFDFVGEIDPLFGLQAKQGARINLSHNGGGVDIEAEGGEFYLDPTFGATIPIEGPSHEEGGVKFKAKDGSYILSDYVKIPGSLVNGILNKQVLKDRENLTIADVIRKFPKQFDTKNESEVLTDRSLDPIKRRSIELNMRRKLNNLSQLLAYQQAVNENHGEEGQEQEQEDNESTMKSGGPITLKGVNITGKSGNKKDRDFKLSFDLPSIVNSYVPNTSEIGLYNRLSEIPEKGVLYDKFTGEIIGALPDPSLPSMDVDEYKRYAIDQDGNTTVSQLELLDKLSMMDSNEFQEAPRLYNVYDMYDNLQETLQQYQPGTTSTQGVTSNPQSTTTVQEGATGAVQSNVDYFAPFANAYQDVYTDPRTGRKTTLNDFWKYRVTLDPAASFNHPSTTRQVISAFNKLPRGTAQTYKLNDQGKLITDQYTGPMYKGSKGDLPFIQSATPGYSGFYGGVTPGVMRDAAVYNYLGGNDQEYNALDEAAKNKQYAELMGLQSFDPNDYSSSNAQAQTNLDALMKQITTKFPEYAAQAQQFGYDPKRIGIDQIEALTKFDKPNDVPKTKCVCDEPSKSIKSVPDTDPRAGVECAGDYAKVCGGGMSVEESGFICDKDGNVQSVSLKTNPNAFKTEAEARATCPGKPGTGGGSGDIPQESLPIEYGLGLLPDPRSTNYRETYDFERYDPRLISLRSLKNSSISQMNAMNRAAGFDPSVMGSRQAQAYGDTMDQLSKITEKENITNTGILNEAEKYNTEIGMKEQALQQAANKKFVDENNADLAGIIDDRFSKLKSLYEAQQSVGAYNQALKFGQSMYGDMYKIGNGTIDRNDKPLTLNDVNSLINLITAAQGSQGTQKKKKGGAVKKRIIY